MRVGIIGGGQLGRMLGQAALPLGARCTFLEPAPDPCAAAMGDVIRAPYDDPAALDALAARSDVVTYEFENVPVDAARHLARRVLVFPPPAALEAAQDRVVEKRFFRAHGVSTAEFLPVGSEAELRAAVDVLGLPAILKTRRYGYDGKGQRVLRSSSEVAGAFDALGGAPCILEASVPFDRELSILACRGRDGTIVTWPLVENHHGGGILRWSVVPAPGLDAEMQARGDRVARRLLEALDYVGVLAIELFQVGDALLANEMAPRVHNSGHWSIEGSVTGQFENHVRAVLGLPLGRTDVLHPCACVNLIGTVPELTTLLAVPGARVHLYGKEPKAGRKLGHVTVLGATAAEVRDRLAAVRALATGD